MQVRGYVEVQAGAVCKTVGSAYVGSNPTPATTCENGPLAAETRPGAPFLLVTPCIRMRHHGSMHGSVHVHMVYSVRAKLAVRITARSAVRRPTTLKTPTACIPEPRGPEVRERRAVIVSTMSACLKAAVARWTRDHAAAGLDGMTTPSGRPYGRPRPSKPLRQRAGQRHSRVLSVHLSSTLHVPAMELPGVMRVDIMPGLIRSPRRCLALRAAKLDSGRHGGANAGFTAGSCPVLSCGLCRRCQGVLPGEQEVESRRWPRCVAVQPGGRESNLSSLPFLLVLK